MCEANGEILHWDLGGSCFLRDAVPSEAPSVSHSPPHSISPAEVLRRASSAAGGVKDRLAPSMYRSFFLSLSLFSLVPLSFLFSLSLLPLSLFLSFLFFLCFLSLSFVLSFFLLLFHPSFSYPLFLFAFVPFLLSFAFILRQHEEEFVFSCALSTLVCYLEG